MATTAQVWKEESLVQIYAEYPCKICRHFIFHSKQFLLNHYKTDHTLEELAQALVED